MPLPVTLTLARAVLYCFCAAFRSVPPPCPTHRYLSANKKMKSKSKKEGKDGASEAGVVLKIYVENFMCHRKLSVPLCRRVLVLVQLLYTVYLGCLSRLVHRGVPCVSMTKQDAICHAFNGR